MGRHFSPFNFSLVSLTEHIQGGVMFIPGHFEEVSNATLKFQEEVKDPKASIIPTFNYVMGSVRTYFRACICLSVDLTATGPAFCVDAHVLRWTQSS